MTLYKELLKAVREKKKYEFDFQKRVIRIGEVDWDSTADEDLISESDLENYYIENLFSEPWEVAHMLWQIYYESVGNSRKYPVFKHKDKDEMTIDELAFGEDRRFAEVQLEAYLLMLGRLGKLNFGRGFFHQDIEDKEFVVMKKWIM